MPEGAEHSEHMASAHEPAAAPSEIRSAPQTLQLRGTALHSPRQLRKLRLHEEEFAHALTARLSSFLRAEVVLTIASIDILPYQRLTAAWTNACHVGLFKTEPLRGVSILHLPLALGLALVDRMMGGPGKAVVPDGGEMSEIEKALLDQLTLIFLEEWCANWAAIRELRPSPLGSESSGSFLQTAPPQTNMLALSMRCVMGESEDQIIFAIPYPALEPLLRQLTGDQDLEAATPAPQPAPVAVKWNPGLDDVKIALTAEWHGVELSAREILHLQVGDVVPVSADSAAEVVVRLGDLPKFLARLGAVNDKWAVELLQLIKT